MSMEIQPLELTVADILRLHRSWITMLLVEEKKTETEIVELLYERKISISLHQLHRLLQEWELIPRSSSITTSASAKPSPTSERRAIVTATEPESRAAYEQRPLPLLPGPPRASSSRRARECDRIPQPTHPTHLETAGRHHHRHRRVEGALGSAHAQEGSSPLEDYVMDAQTHEMIAIGLVQLRRHERAYL